ncbi:MAG: hypothetical protein WBE58_00905 [Verrucomicrobiales bacterium]
MKNSRILCTALLACCLLPSMAPAQSSREMEAVSRQFDDIESRLENLNAARLERTFPLGGGGSIVDQVWFDENDQPEKVLRESYDDHGSRRQELWLRHGRTILVMTHSETIAMVENAPTKATETREYFHNGRLFRILRKSATFGPNEDPDMSAIKNTEQPLPDEAEGANRAKAYERIAADIAKKLQAGGDVEPIDARAPLPGPEAEGSLSQPRVIGGTESPDGKYALAWGFHGGRVDWNQFHQTDGTYMADPAEPGLTNYVVSLPGNKIVCQTSGSHFGDLPNYNHTSATAIWSADSRVVAAISRGKWDTLSADLILLDGGRCAGTVPLLESTRNAAVKKLKTMMHPGIRKHPEQLVYRLHDFQFAARKGLGPFSCGLEVSVPKSQEDGDDINLHISGNLQADRNGNPLLLIDSVEPE